MPEPAAPPLSSRPAIERSAQARIRYVRYDPATPLGDARRQYFAANGFPLDGGYDARWVDFMLGPIPMPFPNSAPRRRAVPFHDLHHVLTGYQTDIFGEAEISGWELGSGCAGMAAAWVLNLGGMALGVLICPRRTWRAFARGRQSANLYRQELDARLLARTVGELRRELRLDRPPAPARLADAAVFFLYWQLGAWASLLMAPLVFLLPLAAIPLNLMKRRAAG